MGLASYGDFDKKNRDDRVKRKGRPYEIKTSAVLFELVLIGR